MHEHIKIWPDGTRQKVGETIVNRESVWNDAARARAVARVEYDQSIDRDTNLPYGEAYRDQPFVVTDLDNFAAVAMEQQRLRDEADAKQNPKNYPQGWQSGRKYAVRPATAEELEEARAKEVLRGD